VGEEDSKRGDSILLLRRGKRGVHSPFKKRRNKNGGGVYGSHGYGKKKKKRIPVGGFLGENKRCRKGGDSIEWGEATGLLIWKKGKDANRPPPVIWE